MSEYTPTTEEVRKSFIYGERYKSDKMYPVVHPDRIKDIEDDFDLWLAEVKAQVWDEAYTEGYRHGTCDVEPSDNPYRGENK